MKYKLYMRSSKTFHYTTIAFYLHKTREPFKYPCCVSVHFGWISSFEKGNYRISLFTSSAPDMDFISTLRGLFELGVEEGSYVDNQWGPPFVHWL
ncbi:hypothetical protein GDO78_015339 [Eleutherodactylus coqui]|uniref:Uncharacterized protein n=1 Tax=Eleutherodactylus coqui TaxID=57060 RepID=A0A8J6JP89_ELECQ|nr:hypothetical protein GDO78_015339 [Eleutherodactylus coqui]